MHERISIDTLCFPGASFRDFTGIWRELGARRVSLVSTLIEDEGVSAAQAALGTGNYQVETIPHPFLGYARHLEPREQTWQEPPASLTPLIENPTTPDAQSF